MNCKVCEVEMAEEHDSYKFGTCSKECARTAVLTKTIQDLFPVRFGEDRAPCIRVAGSLDSPLTIYEKEIVKRKRS